MTDRWAPITTIRDGLYDRISLNAPESALMATETALLHDIGHYPFSHAIEELGPPILKHEQVGRRIILGSEVADVLARVWAVDPARVADLIDPPGPAHTPQDALIRGLLSGAL